MNFKENESSTKLRGGYYTPEPVAAFLSKWALGIRPKSVLEPSCGDGAFVRAIQKNLEHSVRLTGIERLSEEAEKARVALNGGNFTSSEVLDADFLEWALPKLGQNEFFDAVVGNPPYIRYQYLDAADQAFSEAIFAHYGLSFTKHTNAWVPFVIASIGLLAPGGRLAMVIPSEILHVLHAGSLRKFLLSECRKILMVDPNELLFDEALQGTVLLMLEKKASPKQEAAGVCVLPMPDNRFLSEDPEPLFASAVFVAGDVLNGKWMKVLLTQEELRVFEKARRLPNVRRFADVASVDVGIVTGANKFFLVDDTTVAQFGLETYAKPMFGRSEHCPGVVYDEALHRENRSKGFPTNFVMFGNVPFSELTSGGQKYVKYGESQDLDKRYKCRIRKPWYSVPSIYTTPVGMLKRSNNFPRLILNSAEAFTTDTAYRIRTTDSDVSAESLVYAFVNSLTALTAELEGRHYGGGVLELVPSEIEKLSVPVVPGTKCDLADLDRRMRGGENPDSLLLAQDDVILKAAGLTKTERLIIHQAWRRVRSRRHRLIPEE